MNYDQYHNICNRMELMTQRLDDMIKIMESWQVQDEHYHKKGERIK